jgi:hypothetical protein
METTALTVPTDATTLKTGLAALARVLSSQGLTTPELVKAFDLIKALEANLKDLEKTAKAQLLQYVRETGTRITEAGSLRATAGGYSIEATVRNSGYDPDKVQMLLRAKGLDVASGCDATVSYKPNPDKLSALVDGGRLTALEVENTRHSIEYNLKRPVKVDD